MKNIALILAFLSFSVLAETPIEKGARIAQEMEKANQGYIGEKSQVEMRLKDANGNEAIREMEATLREVPGDGDMGLLKFIKPLDVKGSALLTHAHRAKDDDQWVYLRSVKRAKRIVSTARNASFMGSEFSYEDFGGQQTEKYQHTWLSGDTKTDVIERVPHATDSAYSKQVVTYSRDVMNPVKVDYYDRKGMLIKTALFENYGAQTVNKKKIFRPESIVMKNLQTRRVSTMSWKNRKLGEAPPEKKFAPERLGE